MDNVCHTLVGAALAEAGLKRRTALGTATLIIGANFPDIDVLAVPFGHGVDFRRGWTHGVLALVVLPFVLTLMMLACDRWVVAPRAVREGIERPRGDAVPRELLVLSAIAILTHSTLDWMNEYGMRWLMPFSGRWFYGDTLFIIDPWLWAALGLCVALARRTGTRPARVALVASAAYVIAMLALGAASRRIARRELTAQGLDPSSRLMVSANFANPLQRRVLLDDGGRYHSGSLALGSSRLAISRVIETNAASPAAIQAAATPEGRRFLVWSRFPFYVIESRAEGILVRIADARYSFGRRGGDWASVEVVLPPSDPATTEAPASP
jgi:inner membrane protein